jgi:hypothetical protein
VRIGIGKRLFSKSESDLRVFERSEKAVDIAIVRQGKFGSDTIIKRWKLSQSLDWKEERTGLETRRTS